MPREAQAYLADILESFDAIEAAVRGLDLDDYRSNRLVRSAVERELTIIGEAVNVLARRTPAAVAAITQARRIGDFRNQLTHEYPSIDDVLVWGFIDRDAPLLRRECSVLMGELGVSGGG